MKKHRQQMKAAEINALEAVIRTYASPEFITHTFERMAEKKVTAREIELCLRHGQAVEIHNEAETLRVVVRFAYGKPKVAVCIVLDLETNAVITTWKNSGSDNHSTLNAFAYQWEVSVTSLLAAL